MRVKRVVLEHHGNIPIGGIGLVDHPVADLHRAFGDVLEPGDHAQQRGLAAAGGADEHDELAVPDVDIDVMHGAHAAMIVFADLTDFYRGHFGFLICRFR
ncbi:hypothetical protein D3C72_1513440 [compost metagenome]